MCGTHLSDALPQTTVTYTVSFTHSDRRWYGHVCGHSTGADGEVFEHGNISRQFGPFDGVPDVTRWLVSTVYEQTKLQALRDNLKRD